MSEVPQGAMTRAVNQCFQAEGLPQRIKIDNGLPLVYPAERDLPTLPVLWWIGLGIEVVYNTPGCPEQNGTVEGLQGICFRWSDPARCASMHMLQEAVKEANRIQRAVYRIPKKQYQTRKQLYPQLETNPRRYHGQAFVFERVKQHLAQKVWKRIVKKNGCIKFYTTEIYIAQAAAGQVVTVTFDPLDPQWLIRSTNGTLLKTSQKALITEALILDHVNRTKTQGDNLLSDCRGTT